MACNCATQEQLNELYKKYGREVDPDVKTTLGFRVRKFIIRQVRRKTRRADCVICLDLVINIKFLWAKVNIFN